MHQLLCHCFKAAKSQSYYDFLLFPQHPTSMGPLSVYLSQVELIQMNTDGLPRLPGPWQFGPGASCARAAGCVAGLYCAATPRETAYAQGRHVGKWMENAWRCWRWKMLSSKLHSECADSAQCQIVIIWFGEGITKMMRSGRTLTTACGQWPCFQMVNIDVFGASSWNCNLVSTAFRCL